MHGGHSPVDVSSCLEQIRILAAGADGTIICNAEGEDGVMSALILFGRRGKPVLRFANQTLTDALFAHWRESVAQGAPWAELTITLADGVVSIDANSPGVFQAPPIEARIPRLIKKHFASDDWDDSDPEPPVVRKVWWRFW